MIHLKSVIWFALPWARLHDPCVVISCLSPLVYVNKEAIHSSDKPRRFCCSAYSAWVSNPIAIEGRQPQTMGASMYYACTPTHEPGAPRIALLCIARDNKDTLHFRLVTTASPPYARSSCELLCARAQPLRRCSLRKD